MKKLKAAEQAVLTAIGQLGHGNVHQIAEASGYARSTVDKAIKVLADAGMIAEYDTGADPAEGAPTQWQLTGDEVSAPIGAGEASLDGTVTDDAESAVDDPAETAGHDVLEGSSDDSGTGSMPGEDDGNFDDDADADDDDDDVDEDGEKAEDDDDDDAENGGGDSSRKPSNQRVLMIAGAMVAFPEGATIAVLHKSTNLPENALDRLLAAMVSGGAAVLVGGVPRRWRNGTADPAVIDPFPPVPRCGDCQRALPAGWTPAATSTEPEEGRKAPDPKVLMLAGAMFPYTGGATAAQLAADSRLAAEMVARLLPAMETAGVAIRVTTDDGEQAGESLWMLKPGPLHTVDPEPKCTGCGRPKPGVRSSRSTPTGTRRADALPRNMLKDATLRFVLARPGIVLSPGAIAGGLEVELGRDTVSPGAVKNNCEVFAAEGKILLVSSKPWLFSTLPGTAENAAIDESTLPGADLAATALTDAGGEGDSIQE